MKSFIPVVILICSLSASAQTYLPFHKGRPAYYQFDYNAYATFYTQAAIAIDSFKIVGSDTVFFHSPIMNNNLTCLRPNDTSFLGIKSIRTADGRDLFFNRTGDTIAIKNNARLHESWELIKGRNDTATVDSIVEEKVLGVMDSVKVINLRGYGTLRIGKASGIISGVSLFYLPSNTFSFEMLGIENPSLGTSLPFDSVFNFNVGDRFDFIAGSEVRPTHSYISYTTIIINSKSFNGNSFNYGISFKNYSSTFDATQVDTGWVTRKTSGYNADTTTQTFKRSDYKFLNDKPFQWDAINAWGQYSWFEPSDYQANSMVKVFDNEDLYQYDSCLQDLVSEGPDISRYAIGLGKAYDYSGNSSNYTSNILTYYGKGNTEWGDSINWGVLTGVANVTKPSNFSIFPNPASNILHIKGSMVSQPADVILLNYLGEEIKSYRLARGNDNILDISALPQGLYFIQIKTGGGTTSLKFVKAE